jgi:hypothetical protein
MAYHPRGAVKNRIHRGKNCLRGGKRLPKWQQQSKSPNRRQGGSGLGFNSIEKHKSDAS